MDVSGGPARRAARAFAEATLFERGRMLPPPRRPAPERAVAIACGALAREIEAVRDAAGWGWLDVEALPARLHNRPEAIAPAARMRVRAARARGYGRIVLGYAECGAGDALRALCAEEGAAPLAGAHCFHVFGGGPLDLERTLPLTDFMARNFDALIWRGLGLNRHPDLRDVLFAQVERVLHLAQEDDPTTETAARDAAARLALPYERRRVGRAGLAARLAEALDRA